MEGYSKAWWGLGSLLRWRGSAVPRALPFTLLAIFETALLHFVVKDGVESLREKWTQPYPFHTFAVLVAFIVAFRYDQLPPLLLCHRPYSPYNPLLTEPQNCDMHDCSSRLCASQIGIVWSVT